MKKLLSMILVLSMLLSMSITAFAEDVEPASETPITIDVIAVDTVPENAVDTFEEAMDFVENTSEDSVTVLIPEADSSEEGTDLGGVVIDESVNIDLNGNNVVIGSDPVGSSGTQTLGMQVLNTADNVNISGGGTLTIQDSEVEGEDIKMGIQNYSDLVLSNVTINGEDLTGNNPNYVVSNNSGSLTVDDGASIIADEGDVAFDVYFYAPYYPDAPEVTITEDAGTIRGTIEFDGDDSTKEGAEVIANTVAADGPRLTIEGGIFENFLLKIGAAVETFIENITISGGTFSNANGKDSAVVDNTGKGLTFDDFVDKEVYAIVDVDGTTWKVVPLSEVNPEEDDVVAIIPTPEPEPVYTPAPAPAPQPTAAVVATAPVAVEVNGAAVELVIEAKEIEAEVVAPAAAGEAAQLKVSLAPAVLEVEGVEASAVIEALVATVTVEVKGGEAVTAESYEITFNENGELSIELSAEYMEALGPGKHIIVLKIGGIEIEFTVVIK